jgi:Flp pilus assembly protein TadG
MANTFIFDDEEQQPESGTPGPEEPNEPEQPEGGESSNRTFLIIAVVLGGIVLLSLICMAGYALLILPGQRAALAATQDFNNAIGTQTAIVEQATAQALLFTATPSPTNTPIPVPTETPVVVFATESPTGAPTSNPATATVEALETQLAASNLTSTAQATAGLITPVGTAKSTQLSRTGFADEVGLPGLFIIAIILVAVILLARRLRQSPLSR